MSVEKKQPAEDKKTWPERQTARWQRAVVKLGYGKQNSAFADLVL